VEVGIVRQALFTVLILLLCSPANAESDLTKAEVISFFERYEHALETEDFSQVEPFIHPDAVFRFSEGDFVGLGSIKTAFEKTWSLDVQDVKYFLTNIDIINLSAQSATVIFNWNWSGSADQGPFQIVGRGTSQIVLVGGQPKFILEHLSR